MDIRIAYRDTLIPVRGLKKAIPTGRKYRITEEKKEEIILAAFRDHFTMHRNCHHVNEVTLDKKTSKLDQILKQLPYSTEERKYLIDMLPKEIVKILEGHHMSTSDFGGGITCAFWGEHYYSLRYSRECVVYRFPRVYRDYKQISGERYINECVKKVSLRLKMSEQHVREQMTLLTPADLLKPDTTDVLATAIRGRLEI